MLGVNTHAENIAAPRRSPRRAAWGSEERSSSSKRNTSEAIYISCSTAAAPVRGLSTAAEEGEGDSARKRYPDHCVQSGGNQRGGGWKLKQTLPAHKGGQLARHSPNALYFPYQRP